MSTPPVNSSALTPTVSPVLVSVPFVAENPSVATAVRNAVGASSDVPT
jgi:hypothetical protein